jgi:hypothetical protein
MWPRLNRNSGNHGRPGVGDERRRPGALSWKALTVLTEADPLDDLLACKGRPGSSDNGRLQNHRRLTAPTGENVHRRPPEARSPSPGRRSQNLDASETGSLNGKEPPAFLTPELYFLIGLNEQSPFTCNSTNGHEPVAANSQQGRNWAIHHALRWATGKAGGRDGSGQRTIVAGNQA